MQKSLIYTHLQIKETGSSFPATETARVKKLLEGKLSDTKKDTLQQRINILSSFNVKPAQGEKDL